MTLVITVFCNPGEPSTSVNRVSMTDIKALDPLLECIKSHRGFFPTGSYITQGRPSARDIYGKYSAWDVLDSLLPKPASGIANILKVQLFREEPLVMDMLE